jgi:hypothetical protein
VGQKNELFLTQDHRLSFTVVVSAHPCYNAAQQRVKGKIMTQSVHRPQAALKYEVEVREQGRVEVHVPFAPGARVVVFVIPELQEPFSDLLSAAESSLAFWDNPLDDEDWNDA